MGILYTLTALAQATPGTAIGTAAAATADAVNATADAAAESGGLGAAFGSMIPWLVIYGVVIFAMYWFMFRPQRKRDKEMQSMQKNIKSGDNVVTSSGFYGKVVDVGQDCFVIEFGSNRGLRVPVRKGDVVGIATPNINPSLKDPAGEKSE